ncbi:hypothetical protein P170DRAFT_397106 [Aspergillus steynii IBT 23096]|uniref:Uncharacterized protein n=1 Tax=Aspergillus steynii IBT 23096 TaxID=1392250 RepID=A0A2I2GMI0_9EURO|nr:uncharacterized protein P170DRAFT_397106 [Aspergillus steynii IBT 23096]PLB54075.1 hypothetical protein P170DRAFT_397106 [Aspergillus steynii IBT 23096]
MSHSDCDPLRPDKLSSSQVSIHSLSTWRALLSSAQSSTHLPHCCGNIKSLLSQTPSIPESAQVIEELGNGSLFIQGYSTWSVSAINEQPNPHCELPPIKQTLPRKIYIGESCPGTCDLSNSYFPEWPGLQPLSNTTGNYMAVFLLGWSYVLSARLIEVRRRTAKDKVVYTDNMAPSSHDVIGGEYFDLDIGCDCISAVRWWAAILAGGRGWQAAFEREHGTYFSPWEFHLTDSSFRIRHDTNMSSSSSNLEPPSSAEAQEYLFKMARRHNAFDQLICAVAGAMTLPTHNRFGASVTLPKPIIGSGSRQDTEVLYSDQIPTPAEIPHYMAFSGTSGLLASCLFGSFWEPGIPCNLTSEWLNPAMKELTSTLFQSKQAVPIIWAMSKRRPNVASLWLGATITGLLPRILKVSQTFLPTSHLEAVAWTGSPQSFMDPSNHRSIKTRRKGSAVMISRGDEFRLLYLTDTLSDVHGNPPICPYPPFGEVDLQQTSLQVRLHFSCNHRLVYRSWEWQCRNGQSLSDFGMPIDSRPPRTASKLSLLPSIWTLRTIVTKILLSVCAWMQIALSIAASMPWSSFRPSKQENFNDRLSALATRNLFSWTFFTQGIRTEERSLFKHEWLEMLVTRDTGADCSQFSSSGVEDEAKHLDFEDIRRWQENVSAETVSG